jgi:hypothetical protein
MKHLSKLSSLLFCLVATLPPAATAQPSPAAEREARAAFVNLIDAAKQRDTSQFRSLIASPDLKAMEEMDKGKPGFVAMMMEMMADTEPSKYAAEVKPAGVTFRRQVVTQTADSKGTQSTTFTMVREGNDWKFGEHS